MIQMFVDFNCPFCFVQSERLLQFKPTIQVEYRFIEHAPNVISHANTADQLALLNEEYDIIVERGSDISISKPSFCVNTRLAILYYLSMLESYPHKAKIFRTLVYRAYWQHDRDISKPEEMAHILKQLDCEGLQPSETAIDHFRETQSFWLNGDLDQRIPAMRSDKNGLLLGLQHIDTINAYVAGNESFQYIQGEICKPDNQQKIALVDLAPLAEILFRSSALYEIQQFATVDQLLADYALHEFKVILFKVSDNEQAWQGFLKLKESTLNRYLPLIAITEEHSPKLIKQGYILGANDVFNLVTVDEYILPCLASRITSFQLLNTLSDHAQIDGLTQLWNKRSFLDYAQRKWRNSCRMKSNLAVIIMDIDNFKAYNDEYGHLTGDKSLQKIGYMLNQALHRPDDIAARFGGEEFCLVLPDTDYQGACKVIERIQEGLRNLAIDHCKNSACDDGLITMSYGGVICVGHPDHALMGVLEKADQALYQAKDLGRNQAKLIEMVFS